MHALVLTGAGRHADPWHDFPATTACIVAALTAAGISTSVTEDIEGTLAQPPGASVLVLNFGNPSDENVDRVAEHRAATGAFAHVLGGGGIVALHVTSTTMTSSPDWSRLLGGRWIRGVTWHPDFGPSFIHVDRGAHSIVDDIDAFTTLDERYTCMDVEADVRPLAWHEHEGVQHPLLWTREHGAGRVVYHALGHATVSYDPPEAVADGTAQRRLGGPYARASKVGKSYVIPWSS